MDEYADEDGNTAPSSGPAPSRPMWAVVLSLIDAGAPAAQVEQIHFPPRPTWRTYAAQIDDLGGADVCYGGIGWCGHIAFWEAHLAVDSRRLDRSCGRTAPRGAPPDDHYADCASLVRRRLVVGTSKPSRGPGGVLGAPHRSFWLDGDLGGGICWQRFIARLVAHGPGQYVGPRVPSCRPSRQTTRCWGVSPTT